MNRLRRWWRRRSRIRRRTKAAKRAEHAPLREFVYLDDVSVYSLIASRLGPIAAEFTDTESASLLGEVGSSAGVTTGFAKAGARSRVEATQTQSSQVVRKSIIQAQFKELVELERDNLVLRPRPEGEGAVPEIADVADIERLAEEHGNAWLIDPATLKRGQLVEVEVELDAEAIFRVSAILSTMLEMLQENPDLFGVEDREGLAEAIQASRVLDRLLVGLVPLRGRVVDYRSISLGDREWIAHKDLLLQLSVGNELAAQPVHLVGVAEAGLFWKDIRRVLFSHSRHVVMARLGRDGLQSDWTPVKLVEVLKEVVPAVGEAMDDAGEGLLEMMRSGQTSVSDGARQEAMRNALIMYAGSVAEEQQQGEIKEQDLASAGLLDEAQITSYESIEDQRSAFAEVTAHLEQQFNTEINREDAARLRDRALTDMGLELDGTLAAVSVPVESDHAAHDHRYLDSELVAIYW